MEKLHDKLVRWHLAEMPPIFGSGLIPNAHDTIMYQKSTPKIRTRKLVP